jgi:soluble lytic murein transglycosylase-like protein
MRGLERLLFATLCTFTLLVPLPTYAGTQRYEPLADSVRSTLASALRNQDAPVLHFQRSEDAYRWLFEMSKRLAKRVPDRASRIQLLRTVHYEATRAGLDPQLVLSVIDVESSFRKYAVSRSGARGYMQVMPFWLRQIGRPTDNLFHTRTNLRYGCVILRHYLDIEDGDHERALGRYNGSRGSMGYANRVVNAWKRRWHYEGPTH